VPSFSPNRMTDMPCLHARARDLFGFSGVRTPENPNKSGPARVRGPGCPVCPAACGATPSRDTPKVKKDAAYMTHMARNLGATARRDRYGRCDGLGGQVPRRAERQPAGARGGGLRAGRLLHRGRRPKDRLPAHLAALTRRWPGSAGVQPGASITSRPPSSVPVFEDHRLGGFARCGTLAADPP
jgi:hypothetical protein